MTATAYPHIVSDESGTLLIKGTRVKLAILVENHIAYGSDAEQLQKQFPDITRAQAHAALAYYYDNQTEVEQIISARRDAADRWIRSQVESPARRRLQELKKSVPG